MDKNGLSSFLLGLGVGIGIGMLFAPKSGQETRELIKNKAGEGTDFLKQRSSDLKQSAAEWVEKGKEALGRQKEDPRGRRGSWTASLPRHRQPASAAARRGRRAVRHRGGIASACRRTSFAS